MKHVLIVEDEKKLADVLIAYLNQNQFKVTHFESGSDVVDWVKTNQPNIILLDLMLPDVNGKDLCKEIRQFSMVPIIMVTAMIDEIDRLIGLELGADDYVCKPFSPKEVVARVKAVLRRSEGDLNQAGVGKSKFIDATDKLKDLIGIECIYAVNKGSTQKIRGRFKSWRGI